MAEPSNVDEQIREALLQGNTITAIKLHREATGKGLKEAKEFIEQLQEDRLASRGGARASSPSVSTRSDPASNFDAEIQAALFRGNKIQAIKLHRRATGKGLKEAKEFVKALEVELRRTSPEKFTGPSGGCGSAVLAFAALGGVCGWVIVTCSS